MTVNDLLIAGALHVLAGDDARLAEPASRQDIIDLRNEILERINQAKVHLEGQIIVYGR